LGNLHHEKNALKVFLYTTFIVGFCSFGWWYLFRWCRYF